MNTPVAERVLHRPEAPVADPALVDRRGAHAASLQGSAAAALWHTASRAVRRRGARSARRPRGSPSASRRRSSGCGLPADLAMATLRGHTGSGEDRVVVVDPADDLGRVDRLRAVQGHAELPVSGQRLQPVHLVGDRGQADGSVHQVEVPARPGAPAARKQRSSVCRTVSLRWYGNAPRISRSAGDGSASIASA